jgi:pimeloyl-ACP methyl ester carboxylesterase
VAKRVIVHSLVFLALVGASCTNQQLAKYRDDELVRHYSYELGEKYLRAGDLRFCYQEMGQGPSILILPGLGTSVDFWQMNIPALAKEYHVVALDPPGFGKTDKPDTHYDMTWMSEKVVEFMDAKRIGRATIIGGSMGGHLALLIAIRHPERVSKLVLMGSTGDWPPPGVIMDACIRLFWRDAIVIDYLRRNWPGIYGKMFNRRTPATQRLFRYQMALRADEKAYGPEGRSASRTFRSIFYTSCRDRLREVNVPVLLIWGERDHIHGLVNARRFKHDLPDSHLVVVPDAAHEVMMDDPEVFNRLVLEFQRSGTEGLAKGRKESTEFHGREKTASDGH